MFLFGAFRTNNFKAHLHLPLLSTCVGPQGCSNPCGLPSPSLGSTSATSHCKKDLKLFWTEDVKGNLSINHSATSVNPSLASPVCQAHNPTVVGEHHTAKKPGSTKEPSPCSRPQRCPLNIKVLWPQQNTTMPQRYPPMLDITLWDHAGTTWGEQGDVPYLTPWNRAISAPRSK